MKVFIVGLGLIGASYAEKLLENNHQVFGFDEDPVTFHDAKALGIIDEASTLEKISDAELVVLAIYPKACVDFIKKYHRLLHAGQTITDVCGVKTVLLNEIEPLLSNLSYLSHHPMAGKELSGLNARDKKMFIGANFLIIDSVHAKPIDYKRLHDLADDLEFGTSSIVTKEEHDTLIAYTSQLTHVIATCLINTLEDKNANHATGNSFKDLTRIANINAPLWTDLFLGNQDALVSILSRFKEELSTFETLLINQNKVSIIDYLNGAKKRRAYYD